MFFIIPTNNMPAGLLLFLLFLAAIPAVMAIFGFFKSELSTPFVFLSEKDHVDLIYDSGFFEKLCAMPTTSVDAATDDIDNIVTKLIEDTFNKLQDLNPHYAKRIDFNEQLKVGLLIEFHESLKDPRDLLKNGNPFSSVRRDCEEIVLGVEEYCRIIAENLN